MGRRLRKWSRSLVAISCVAAFACSADITIEDASFVTYDGVLLDADLARVGELALPEHASVGSISSDGNVVFSSSIGATASMDCCGPNMQSIFVYEVGGETPEGLFPGQIGIADREPEWAPGDDRVAFIRHAVPTYSDDVEVERPVREGLYVFTVGEDAPELLVEGDFTRVGWSPDGALMAATEGQTEPGSESTNILHIFDAQTGAPVASVRVDGFRFAWAPSSDRLAVEVDAGDFRTAVGFYDIEHERMTIVPETNTLETGVWVWGADGPIIELNRANGSLLARVDPNELTVSGLRRCTDHGPCARPAEVLQD